MAHEAEIRVLIIDDSSYNRQILAQILTEDPDVTVVGKARDGEEGLQLAMTEKPDVITLDLEMPRMDGFTFLRLLMAKQPTPVIVISSHAEKENVFRALELGALDFVAKPTHRISPMIKEIRREVLKKVRLARNLEPQSLHPIPPYGAIDIPSVEKFPIDIELPQPAVRSSAATSVARKISRDASTEPRVSRPPEPVLTDRIVGIAASTGGPAALTRILTALSPDIDACIVVAQHMPPRFTATFAKRLDRQCRVRVKEAGSIERPLRGHAYIVPGQACMELRPGDDGLSLVTVAPTPRDRYVPSADKLFASLAATAGSNAIAVVLTGMGDDGAKGVRDVVAAGGIAVAEDAATAVLPGMPLAAIESGVVSHVAPIDGIEAIIATLVQKG
ncbi:MAG: chemotaxis-specific protein-glutamate methyltransferase CheB [Myxococcota bacterium]|nr:chemotaxis-specific protein-glutamate methyltransferase CheB [Myxococcota bacterium]